MKNLLRSFLRAFAERQARPMVLRYERHPAVRTLGEALFPAEGSGEPMVLNEVGHFMWTS